eukprot:15064792-Alexandrium_andersonii.AAC.1
MQEFSRCVPELARAHACRRYGRNRDSHTIRALVALRRVTFGPARALLSRQIWNARRAERATRQRAELLK